MTQPKENFLKDYRPALFSVKKVTLTVDIGETSTLVRNEISMTPTAQASATSPLVLNGENLELLEVQLNGQKLPSNSLQQEEDHLIIPNVNHALGKPFTLDIKTRIYPQKNTALSGLYASGDLLCTQCEAEGFRRITYYLDRPDVLAPFTTTIQADRATFPVLLSNGNLMDSGDLENGRHFATWSDPFPKPSYLFALVAGPLAVLSDRFTTESGRQVLLEIYAMEKHIEKCHHAMASLKQAMTWDEQVFGLEYDLDRYMIVAVPDFNMGAMENKGLNIFNTSAILASPETATDNDYQRIRGIIAHEYFHNWTGNRVTCRDWFQLSLKEGLTVFRDQQFTSDLSSRTVKRIQDVQLIRVRQFPEDSGPMAHPIRPESYIEMNNFYTVTVYYKGAEVIRMMHTLLGQNGFRRGMDLYFSRHDGQAVTCEDFVAAMEDANDIDLGQFRRWYAQAGTPRISITDEFDAKTGEYVLHMEQSCPETPGQEKKEPFHIPIKIGLLDPKGAPMELKRSGDDGQAQTERVLNLRKPKESFGFPNLKHKPIVSLFRDFSAPVIYSYPYSRDDLCALLAYDPNEFNRWDASQILFQKAIFSFVDGLKQGEQPQLSTQLSQALARCLDNESLEPTLLSELLRVPSLGTVYQEMDPLELDILHMARQALVSLVAQSLRTRAESVFDKLKEDQSAGRDNPGLRALKNRCLAILTEGGQSADLAVDQFRSAGNMTDQLAALACLSHSESSERKWVLDEFYTRWHDDALVLNKWFSIQALSQHPKALDHVVALSNSDDFTLKNPNRVHALIYAFTQNLPFFHDSSGKGYAFVGEKVRQLDELNPQVAARIVRAFANWRRFDSDRQILIQHELDSILKQPNLSKDVFEITSKSLA